MFHDDYTRQMVKDHTDIAKENYRREREDAWRQSHSSYATERDAAFTKMAAEAGRRRRRGRRSLAILLILCLLGGNLYIAKSTGTPVITLYSHTEHGRNASYYKETWSLGFTVHEYYSSWADYRKFIPWFSDTTPSAALNETLADNLASELERLEGSQIPGEYYYLETAYFSGLHVYETLVDGQDVTIYGWLSDGFLSIYNKEAYEVDTRSTPVVIQARLDGSSPAASTSLTVTSLLRSKSPLYNDTFAEEHFPSYLRRSVLEEKGRNDAWQKRNSSVMETWNVPVSEDVLDVDVSTGTLSITRLTERYDQYGSYQFDTQTIFRGQIAERQTESSQEALS